MNYNKAIELLKNDGSNKAYRGAWSSQVTNIHLWMEKGHVCKGDRDGWPMNYNPTPESLNANDWHVSNYGEPLVIVDSEESDSKEIDKLI